MVVIYIILARFSLLMRPLRRVLIMQSILRIMNWYKSLERNYLQSRKKWKTQNQALLSIGRQNISNWLSIKLKQTWVQIIETISRDDLNIDPSSLFMVDRSLPIPYSTDPEPNRSILTPYPCRYYRPNGIVRLIYKIIKAFNFQSVHWKLTVKLCV